MNYDSFKYLYPARPSGMPISPLSIGMMVKLGYVAQKKKNGTCSVIFARGNEVIFRTRHPEIDEGKHRAWQPNDAHLNFFSSLGPKWNVFCAELLHNKGPSIKDELYIFDQLVCDGDYLVERTFSERQQLMRDRWGKSWVEDSDLFRVHKHVSIAKVFNSKDHDFKDMFNNLGPLDEGLVFKLPGAKLARCMKDDSNAHWSQKCRHPKAKTYSF
jgi:hypothetical protein